MGEGREGWRSWIRGDGEREESRSQHDRGKPENEIFALRAPTSKAFGGMPLHNFTLNIIQISERQCVCV